MDKKAVESALGQETDLVHCAFQAGKLIARFHWAQDARRYAEVITHGGDITLLLWSGTVKIVVVYRGGFEVSVK